MPECDFIKRAKGPLEIAAFLAAIVAVIWAIFIWFKPSPTPVPAPAPAVIPPQPSVDPVAAAKAEHDVRSAAEERALLEAHASWRGMACPSDLSISETSEKILAENQSAIGPEHDARLLKLTHDGYCLQNLATMQSALPFMSMGHERDLASMGVAERALGLEKFRDAMEAADGIREGPLRDAVLDEIRRAQSGQLD